MADNLYLVTGATGLQGGAVTRHLLAEGQRVRFLTRNPANVLAQKLIASGAEAFKGNFDDSASIRAAMTGVTGVFSMQNPGPDEVAQGLLLVQEALQAGVQHFIYTSVTGTTEFEQFPDWGKGRWWEPYWTSKWTNEEAVRNAGFPLYTVLRPAYMMENFIPPKVEFMFPGLKRGEIASALKADTKLQMISAEDVARFAVAAFAQPDRFSGHSIDLGTEPLTVAQIAATISAEFSRPIRVVELSPEAAIAGGMHAGWVRSQEWTNVHGYRAPFEALAAYGIALTSFADFVKSRREDFVFA